MNLFAKLFGKKKELSALQRVRGTMERFIEASHIGMNSDGLQTPEHGQLYLTYMFGAVDMLCQTHHVDDVNTITFFQGLLEDLLGGYSPEEAKRLTQVVLHGSGTPDGQRIMREGAETIKMWIGGMQSPPIDCRSCSQRSIGEEIRNAPNKGVNADVEHTACALRRLRLALGEQERGTWKCQPFPCFSELSYGYTLRRASIHHRISMCTTTNSSYWISAPVRSSKAIFPADRQNWFWRGPSCTRKS